MEGKTNCKHKPPFGFGANLSEMFFSCVCTIVLVVLCIVGSVFFFLIIKKIYGKQKRGGGDVQAKVVVKILKVLVYKSVKKIGYKISYFLMQARLKSSKH
jgi:hypothetical protein